MSRKSLEGVSVFRYSVDYMKLFQLLAVSHLFKITCFVNFNFNFGYGPRYSSGLLFIELMPHHEVWASCTELLALSSQFRFLWRFSFWPLVVSQLLITC